MLRVYPPPNFWVLHIDGSARPNPGRMAMGAVLTAPSGASWSQGRTFVGTGCNNEAELRALQTGLLMAREQGANTLRIYTDSRWLVEQLGPPSVPGLAVRPTVRLAPWLDAVRPLLHSFAQVQWRWVPRRLNAEADDLARQASLHA